MEGRKKKNWIIKKANWKVPFYLFKFKWHLFIWIHVLIHFEGWFVLHHFLTSRGRYRSTCYLRQPLYKIVIPKITCDNNTAPPHQLSSLAGSQTTNIFPEMDPNCTQILNEAQMQNWIFPLSFFGCHPWKGKKKIICSVSDNVDRKKKQKKKMSMAAEMTVQTENT